MVTTLSSIDIQPILTYYKEIESAIVWDDYWPKGKQTGVQHRDGEDEWASAVGISKGYELSYNKINPFFKGSILESIVDEYQLKRTRLMWCGPFSCYSIHVDRTPRIHIPLITNDSCLFLFPPNSTVHLATGSVYWVDTRRPHTFINCSEKPRLHLVGIVEK